MLWSVLSFLQGATYFIVKTLYYQQLYDELPILILSSKNNSTSEHKHSFFELSYVVSGSAEHCFGEDRTLIGQGDFYLVDLNSSHEYKKAADSSDLTIINCIFLPEFIDESLSSVKCFQDIIDNYFIKYGGSSETLTGHIFHDESGFIGRIFKNMRSEFDSKKTGYEDIIRNHLQTVLIHIFREHSTQTQRSDANLIKTVKEYVKKNYMKSLQLSDICKKMSFSLSYISMLFKKETGMTFRSYLVKIRIEKACQLLKNSNMTVGTVAGSVGYSDPAFFYKLFRKEMNMTPDDYRKKHSAV